MTPYSIIPHESFNCLVLVILVVHDKIVSVLACSFIQETLWHILLLASREKQTMAYLSEGFLCGLALGTAGLRAAALQQQGGYHVAQVIMYGWACTFMRFN